MVNQACVGTKMPLTNQSVGTKFRSASGEGHLEQNNGSDVPRFIMTNTNEEKETQK